MLERSHFRFRERISRPSRVICRRRWSNSNRERKRKKEGVSPHLPAAHLAGICVVESLYELHSGALATAAGSHQSHSLARADLQVQPSQDLHVRPGRIVEYYVTELDVA